MVCDASSRPQLLHLPSLSSRDPRPDLAHHQSYHSTVRRGFCGISVASRSFKHSDGSLSYLQQRPQVFNKGDCSIDRRFNSRIDCDMPYLPCSELHLRHIWWGYRYRGILFKCLRCCIAAGCQRCDPTCKFVFSIEGNKKASLNEMMTPTHYCRSWGFRN
jgi:hypothetical protein